jgi:hypothetical protein
MFSWICPRCGRENRASDTECAECKLDETKAETPSEIRADTPAGTEAVAFEPYAPEPVFSEPEPPRSPVKTAPPVTIPNPPPVAPPSQSSAPVYRESARPATPMYSAPPKSGLPTWLLIPLFALAFLGLGALLYLGYQRFGGGKAGFTGGEVAAPAAKQKATSPLQKYVEVVGLRLTQDAKKKPQAKFIVVNHGNAELNDLTANVTLWASTSRSEEDSVGTFTFKINSLGTNEAKEITTPLKTRLKMYELPDWQNLTAEVQLTSQ